LIRDPTMRTTRVPTRTHDALTRYTHPVSGPYYVIPSVEALLRAGGTRL
jgi:hypothetical protein